MPIPQDPRYIDIVARVLKWMPAQELLVRVFKDMNTPVPIDETIETLELGLNSAKAAHDEREEMRRKGSMDANPDREN